VVTPSFRNKESIAPKSSPSRPAEFRRQILELAQARRTVSQAIAIYDAE